MAKGTLVWGIEPETKLRDRLASTDPKESTRYSPFHEDINKPPVPNANEPASEKGKTRYAAPPMEPQPRREYGAIREFQWRVDECAEPIWSSG